MPRRVTARKFEPTRWEENERETQSERSKEEKINKCLKFQPFDGWRVSSVSFSSFFFFLFFFFFFFRFSRVCACVYVCVCMCVCVCFLSGKCPSVFFQVASNAQRPQSMAQKRRTNRKEKRGGSEGGREGGGRSQNRRKRQHFTFPFPDCY